MDRLSCLTRYPRVSLSLLPTPIQGLTRLQKRLQGPRLLIKRDDQTGLALGGNKTRKLDYFLGDALQQDVDTLITAGAMHSNHCRQTAAAAARFGFRCELLLHGSPPALLEGNVLLNHLLGAHTHWTENTGDSLESLTEKIRVKGYKPYMIPYGGSNVLGVMGYIEAMYELREQQVDLDHAITHIIFATCAGSTQVGMVLGGYLTGFSGKILGINIRSPQVQAEENQEKLVQLGNRAAQELEIDHSFQSTDFATNYEYAIGYGKVSPLERDAIHLLAKEEGILLDPVYSGRAFGALLDMIDKGELSGEDTVLFWHTGGVPSLFAQQYAQHL